MKLRRVEIEWLDTASNPAWRPTKRVGRATPTVCVTLGYIVRQTKRKTVLAHSLGDHAKIADSTVIPTKAIRRIRPLRLKGGK